MSETETTSLEGWVEAINAALGTSFAPEEPGRLFLEFGGDLRVGVDFPEGAASYDIYAPIGTLDGAAALPRLLAALELNLYQRGTAGGAIGLDMRNGVFVYSFTFPVERASPEILARQIDRFVGHARRLREALAQAAGDVRKVELDALAEELGLTRSDAVETVEAEDRFEGPAPPPPVTMIRV
jgi:hypothetical protein